MVTDQRQQELFSTWASSDASEFVKWLRQQPDREELHRLLDHCWSYTPELNRLVFFETA